MIFVSCLVFALIFAADAASLRQSRGHGRIVGGHDAKIKDYPYQVSIQLDTGHWCGGSIISKNYILTAAHCFVKMDRHYSVRSGSSYHANGGHVHEVIEKIVHNSVDIAIAKVDPPFEFDETQQPIELVDEKPKHGKLANVTGWGNTKDEFNNKPDKLRVVEVPIITQKSCSAAYNTEIPEHEVCAGYLGIGGKDACQGDSGGPLVVDGRQVGIVSWGMGCAEKEYPGVYVNVAHMKTWIKENSDV